MEGKLLLIGQAPLRTGDASKVLAGRSGVWIADLMGVPLAEHLAGTDRVNLFDEWPGRNGKGDRWNMLEAGRRARGMVQLLRGRMVIFVGRSVAAAFGLPRIPWMTWIERFGAEVASIPHPSGIVRWWNDADNRDAAGEFMRAAVAHGGGIREVML